MSSLFTLLMVSALAVPQLPDLWRDYARRVPIGSTVVVCAKGSRCVKAVLMVVETTEIIVKPKTRIPEPIRRIPFDQIQEISVQKQQEGSLKHAAASGAMTAAGILGGMLLMMWAAYGGGG